MNKKNMSIDEIIESVKNNKKVSVVRIFEDINKFRRLVEIFLIPAKIDSSAEFVDLDGLQKLLEGLVSCKMNIVKFEREGEHINFGCLHLNRNVSGPEKWEELYIRLYPNILIAIPAAYCGAVTYYRYRVGADHYFQSMIASQTLAPHLKEVGTSLSELGNKNKQ